MRMRARRSGGVLRHAGNAAFAACTAASTSASLQNGTVPHHLAGRRIGHLARARARGRLFAAVYPHRHDIGFQICWLVQTIHLLFVNAPLAGGRTALEVTD